MEKNDKGQFVIHSLAEMPVSERRQVYLATAGIGSLVLVAAILAYLCLYFPNNHHSDILFRRDAWSLRAFLGAYIFLIGSYVGFLLALRDLGYNYKGFHHHRFESSYQSNAFSSSDSSTIFHSSSHSSSYMSINPGSGLPMCGSSGMDTSGNPYGTRSW